MVEDRKNRPLRVKRQNILKLCSLKIHSACVASNIMIFAKFRPIHDRSSHNHDEISQGRAGLRSSRGMNVVADLELMRSPFASASVSPWESISHQAADDLQFISMDSSTRSFVQAVCSSTIRASNEIPHSQTIHGTINIFSRLLLFRLYWATLKERLVVVLYHITALAATTNCPKKKIQL